MADVVSTRVLNNGPRNYVTKVAILSDGSGTALLKIFDAQAAANGNKVSGQTLLPGLHTTIEDLQFDVQDMKFALYWEATANELIGAFGAAPSPFNWRDIGGITVPPGLAGATGSILLSTVDQTPNSTLTVVMTVQKNV